MDPADPRAFVDWLNQRIAEWADDRPALVVEVNTIATSCCRPTARSVRSRPGRPWPSGPETAGRRPDPPAGLPACRGRAGPAHLPPRDATDGPVGGRLVLDGLLFADVEVTVTRRNPGRPPGAAGPPPVPPAGAGNADRGRRSAVPGPPRAPSRTNRLTGRPNWTSAA